MATEKPQFGFVETPNRKPETKAEASESKEKPADTIPGIGDAIKKDFQTDKEKSLVAEEIKTSLKSKFSQFSPEFQAKYSDGKGEPDYKKIMSLFDLDKSLGSYVDKKESEPQIAKDGKIPENPGSMSGAKFMGEMSRLGNMNSKEVQHQMELRVMEEIAKGNIPSWCRPENMKTIGLKGPDGTVVKFKAGLDYLAIGNDDNFVRVPITPVLAQTLSEKYGWGMPTRTMAYAIHDTADIKLQGIGLVDGQTKELQRQQMMEMQGTGFIQTHNDKINQQLGPQGLARLRSGKALVAGQKKDVIISKYVLDNPNGALDYSGLYGADGKPIQDNPAHEWSYRDYSHGFRPIAGNVIVAYPNGHTESKPYYEALKDPRIAQVLNGAEGAINAAQAYKSTKQKSGQASV